MNPFVNIIATYTYICTRLSARYVSVLVSGLVIGCSLFSGALTAQAFVSGTVFTDTGSTTAGSGITVGIAIGTTTTSVYTVTTTAGGVWSLSGVATTSITSVTPITVWIDASTTDATTLVMGFAGPNISNVPVYYNRVVSRGAVATSTVESSRFNFYDFDNDNDILLVTATSATSTTVLADFINNQGTFIAPATTLIFNGSYHNDATFNNNFGTHRFTGSSKTLSGIIAGASILGRTVIAGSYTVSVGASTTDLYIESGGAFTAPSARLTVTRQFSNAGTFTNNSGELYMDGLSGNIARFLAGTDVSGSAAGNLSLGINAFAVTGNTLYIGKAGGTTACSQTAGGAGARDCELMVFDISSSTNPVFVRGIDAAGAIGGITGVSINTLAVSGTTLYAGLAGTGATACSQTASTTGASNCELQVYDISSSTNPVYVAGRDSSGGAASTTAISINTLAVTGTTLYVGLSGGTTACSQTIGTIGASHCELQVYSIASTTNPVYIAGRDSDGTAAGTLVFAVNKLIANDNTLYIGKAGNTTACSNATGTGAAHCEIQIYSISSTTNPVYVAGRDASGAAAGAGTANVVVNDISIVGNRLYVGKAGSATACSQTAGSADGCELMIYDISSSTGPVYIAGRDTSASDVGAQNLAADTVLIAGDLLYMSKVGSATACSQVSGGALGCELLVFDISSTSNPVYVVGIDANGGATTTSNLALNSLLVVGNSLFVAKAGDVTACSQIAGGAVGCELVVFENTARAYGAVTGTLTQSSALNSLVVAGSVTMTNNASTTNFTVLTNATATPPRVLSVSGNYTNNGVTSFLPSQSQVIFTGASAQSLSGNLSSLSALPSVSFTGAGTKTINNNLSVTGDFSNQSTYNANNQSLDIRSQVIQYVTSRDGGGSLGGSGNAQINTFVATGTILYVGKNGDTGTCDNTTGTGCELMVFDISSSTNPVYVAGRDSSGTQGTGPGGTVAVQALALLSNSSGTVLYAGKAGGATACSQTSGSAGARDCELMIFDISSSTNPVYVAGRDSAGQVGSSTAISINTLVVASSTLYIGLAGGTTACSQTAGTIGASNCELQVYDIASSTNPLYVAGRDSDGTTAGILVFAINKLVVSSTTLYVGKAGNTTACSNTTGTGAAHCEIQMYSLASSTNPVYTSGRDASGAAAGAGTANVVINDISVVGNRLFVGKAGSATACSQTAGSADGCELMVYDISSSTGPVYLSGRDADGSPLGLISVSADTLLVLGNNLYMSKAGSAAPCSPIVGLGSGCELMVFDISSSSNPLYTAGRDIGGTTEGVQNQSVNTIALSSAGTLYAGKVNLATACTQVIDSVSGCELLAFRVASNLSGTLTAASSIGTTTVIGMANLISNASTTNLTIGTSSTLIAPPILSLTNNFNNNGGAFSANGGELILNGAGNQSLLSSSTTTFFALTKNATASSSLTFTSSSTYVVAGNLRLTGGSTSTRLSLLPSVSGSNFQLLPQGSSSVQFVRVTNATNLGSTSLLCTNGCIDGGGNVNWIFSFNNVWDGGGSTNNWSECANWASNICPTAVSITQFDGTSGKNSSVDLAFGSLISGIVMDTGYSGTLSFGQQNFTIATSGLSLRSGTFIAPTSTLALYNGNFVQTVGTFNANGGTVITVGTTTIASSASTSFSNVLVNQNYELTPVSHLRFDESTASATSSDATGNGYSGTSFGVGGSNNLPQPSTSTATTVSFYNTFSKDFDGTDDYVDLTGVPTMTDYTFSVWVNMDSFTNGGSNDGAGTYIMDRTFDTPNISSLKIIGGRFSHQFRDNSGGNLGVVTANTGSAVTTGSWQHVAWGKNGSNMFIAVNGVVDTVATGITLLNPPVPRLGIHASGDTGTAFNGRMDDYRIYNTAMDLDVGTLYAGDYLSRQSGYQSYLSLASSSLDVNAVLFIGASSTLTTSTSSCSSASCNINAAGDWANLGTFLANTATVTFDGTSQQTVIGGLEGTSAFRNLEVSNTSGTGNDTQSILFDTPLQTTGTFTMRASTSAQFLANATSTFAAINWNGQSTSTPIYLRSSIPGSRFKFTTNNFGTMSFIDVKDSNNASTTPISCATCINSGNNLNWGFLAQVITLSGTLYSDLGVTPAPGGVVIKVAVGNSTTTVFSTSTISGGTWFVNPSEELLASTTPIVIWIDASSTDATTLVMGYNNSNITGVPLYYNKVVTQGALATSTINVSAFTGYDRDNDDDILFVTATSSTSTTFFADVIHTQGTLKARADTTVLMGSFTNNATFDDNGGILQLSGTGKNLSGSLIGESDLGAVRVVGNYSVAASLASSTNLTIESGASLTAPADTLSVSKTLSNNGSFNNNSGTVFMDGIKGAVVAYLSGRQMNYTFYSFINVDTTLYVGSRNSLGTCDTVTGEFCELLIYDVSSTSNPVYLRGLESSHENGGANINAFAIVGTTLFMGRTTYTGTCDANTGVGCELIAYNISSTTNPIFITGRESGVTSGGATINSLNMVGNTLYVGRLTYSGTCNASTGEFCELLAYEISSTTNPVFVFGRESGLTSGGGSITDFLTVGSTLFIGRSSTFSSCAPATGDGCELIVYDISSTTNPTFVSGREADANFSGSQISKLSRKDISLYVGKTTHSGICNTVTGDFCELLVYDIASTTNPILATGRESGVNSGGGSITYFVINGSTLYAGRGGYTGACNPTTSEGCELLAYNISSSTNPVFITGRESGDGSGGGSVTGLTNVGNYIYVGREIYIGTSPGSCTSSTGDGCEFLVYESVLPATVVGSFTNTNFLNNLITDGHVMVAVNASATALTINTGTTTLGGTHVSVTNGVTNNAVIEAASLRELTLSGGGYNNNGSARFSAAESTIRLTGTNQTLAGTLSGNSALPSVVLLGSGTKTFATNATTTDITIGSGVTLVAPTTLTVTGDFANLGTFDDGNQLELTTYISDYLAGRESGVTSGGGSINAIVVVGNTLYVGRDRYSGICATSTGQSCELLVYDISSTTNPIFVTGREAGLFSNGRNIYSALAIGNTLYIGREITFSSCTTTTGDGCELLVYDISSSTNPILSGGRESGDASNGSNIYTMVSSGNALYVGRFGYSGACDSATAIGCELLVYDVSSTTNPVFVTGRESGDASGGSTINILTTTGSTLYVGRNSYTGACNTTSGDGCELLAYNVSSTTNPMLLTGRESGDGSGGDVISSLVSVGSTLYVGRNSYTGACNATSGDGCELLAYNVSSTTNPVFLTGRESGDGSGGDTISTLITVGSTLYAGRNTYNGICKSGVEGCELLIYDVSSSSNPVLKGGREAFTRLLTFATTSTRLFVGSFSDLTQNNGACEASTGVGCELLIFDLTGNVSGNLTGTSALGNVGVKGMVTFDSNASTSNLTNEGVITAPAQLSVSAAYTNTATFVHSSGTVVLNGVAQQTVTGTLSSSSAFHNLQVSNTSGNGNTTSAVIFGAPLQTTGTYTMRASTSAQFPANSTSSFASVNWNGGSTATPVYFRSSLLNTRWHFTTNNFVSTSYINVRDANNASTTPVTCASCIDAGNNVNWNFPVSASTLTLAESNSTQVSNAFSFINRADTPFYAFKLTPDGESMAIDQMVFTLTGVRGIDSTKVANLKLFRDNNSNGTLDGGDTQVMASGSLNINGQVGTITFSSTTIATTSRDYLLTSNTEDIKPGEYMRIQLLPLGISATGQTSLLPVVVTGAVSAIQHIRGGSSGGNGFSLGPIGGDAPAGAGQQGGGNTSGGGEAGQAVEGANIVSDPDFRAPTSNGTPHNEWTNGVNGYASDGIFATAATAGLRQTYGGFGFSIPGGNVVRGITVKVDASGSTAAGTIQIGLSWDGGTTITTINATPTLVGNDVVYQVGGVSDLWGRVWSGTELSDTNFRVRIIAQPNSNTVRLDALEVQVFHTAGGGGSGGGSEI